MATQDEVLRRPVGQQLGDVSVKLVYWPKESDKVARYRSLGIPRLLLVDSAAMPPIHLDTREDWVRMPVSRQDLHARIAVLDARVRAESRPRVDEDGMLWLGRESTPVSPVEANLLRAFVSEFGSVVDRATLEQLVGGAAPASRNALDLHIKRLRRRIVALGLIIKTVRGRGYTLELAGSAAKPA
ncbi:MAG TPA: helix-turn-helix domain-containing protein [Pseudonocardiaceae bacterium]